MKPSEDDILIKQLQSPKTRKAAFERLVSQYSEKLYWTIRRMVLTHEDADDVLQNTYMKVWNKLDEFKGNSKVYTWLYRVAVNEALDFIRHEKAMACINASEDSNVADKLLADNYFDGNKSQALLHEAITLLPEVQRTVFNLRYFNEMKYSEMCDVLHTSEGALKASYHIAVKKIAKYVRQKTE